MIEYKNRSDPFILAAILNMMIIAGILVNRCNRREFDSEMKAREIREICMDGTNSYSVNSLNQTNYFRFDGKSYVPVTNSIGGWRK